MSFIFSSVFGQLPAQTPQDCNIWYTEIFICSSFPCHFAFFCAFGIFCLLSPPRAFLSEFFIQAPLSIMSFCVRDVCNFQLTDREEILAILYSYDLVLCFDKYCFLMSFDSYHPFSFQFLAWDHLYIIYCLPCFLSMGLLLSAPQDNFKLRWMEP